MLIKAETRINITIENNTLKWHIYTKTRAYIGHIEHIILV